MRTLFDTVPVSVLHTKLVAECRRHGVSYYQAAGGGMTDDPREAKTYRKGRRLPVGFRLKRVSYQAPLGS